ncbi:LOW QUALITY PROTEIN: ankyrin repeat-containing protein BDA1-like [Dioscorea cayenensis subsp. rotundata]|uniref:LOW QUALITY PROTEIN: ankyrin repeat-containing protein BDA1-like n=1 Tax=Dioscorea cayennensis subsp. rotundata TaxID=55577 RepID=A0AB40B470_DIOCR|nr:LOW QUALITY PROTEIN: ankyrin repeat-containing protein BDA1-like [Dioscorea cayenensis subsp. rotundata]
MEMEMEMEMQQRYLAKYMDLRLEEACLNGDLDKLRRLLKEDNLMLHRFSSSVTAAIDNPLHMVASLGHTDLANELVIWNPKLALDLNPRGLSALHLASAHGDLEIVKLLISKVGSHLCFLKDKDGRLPIHSASMKGRIEILDQLIKVCPESARALTYQNESILHLAVQFNSFETLEFLVKKLEVDDDIDEILNLKDDKGNTILHHSIARRQLQSVKLLLSKGEKVEVNAMNHKGLTALDVLLDSPSQHGDLTLGEVIRVAGGKVAIELDPHQPSLQAKHIKGMSLVILLIILQEAGDDRAALTLGPNRRLRNNSRLKITTLLALMVVATLIATITFQSGLNPPGGFTQDNGNTTVTNITNSTNSTASSGIAVLGSNLSTFLFFDMIGLFASLSIILVLICVVPRKKKKMMKILVVIMWVSVFSTALAFSAGIYKIFPDSNRKKSNFLLRGWLWILRIFMLCMCLQFVVYMLRKVGWWRKKEGDGLSNIVRRGGCLLWCLRIGVLLITLFLLAFFGFFYYVAFVAWDLNKTT